MEESSQVLPESCIKIFTSDINACNVHYKRAPRLKLLFLYTLPTKHKCFTTTYLGALRNLNFGFSERLTGTLVFTPSV